MVGCNTASEPVYESTPTETRRSIAGLKSRCDGSIQTRITEDLAIRGQVVANDLFGEFLQEIVIQDESGGIGIALEGEQLHDRFPFGALVEIRCNGLMLFDYGGKVGIGSEADDWGNRAIPAEEIDRHVRISTEVEQMPRAVRLAFDEVGSRHIDTRVRFDRVQFAEPGKTWCDTDPENGRFVTTEREIIDPLGRSFVVRTLRSCIYAMEPLPNGNGSIIGVIDYFAGKYSVRVTFRELDFTDYDPQNTYPEGGGSDESSPRPDVVTEGREPEIPRKTEGPGKH